MCSRFLSTADRHVLWGSPTRCFLDSGVYPDVCHINYCFAKCFSYFVVSVIKHHDQKPLREGRVLVSSFRWVETIRGGQGLACWQEWEADRSHQGYTQNTENEMVMENQKAQ